MDSDSKSLVRTAVGAVVTGLIVGIVVGLLIAVISALLPTVELNASQWGLVAGLLAAAVYVLRKLDLF